MGTYNMCQLLTMRQACNSMCTVRCTWDQGWLACLLTAGKVWQLLGGMAWCCSRLHRLLLQKLLEATWPYLGLCIQHALVREALVADLVQGIAGIADQLAEEDLLQVPGTGRVSARGSR